MWTRTPVSGLASGGRRRCNKASARCEAVICLLSKHWLNSHECQVEFRYAENLHKAILCARLEPVPDANITSEWQRCDLFPDHGPTTEVDIADGGEPVVFDSAGLQRLLNGLRALGIGAEHFPWPPPSDPDRAPYRGGHRWRRPTRRCSSGATPRFCAGWMSLRGMRTSGVESLFVILGPSGAGKSSFLRAGLLPRLRRDDRRFLPAAHRAPRAGGAHRRTRPRPRRSTSCAAKLGFASRCWVRSRTPATPSRWSGCAAGWRRPRQAARDRLLDVPAEQPAPTLVLPVDQAEELFNADAGPEAPHFLELLASLVQHEAGVTPAMIVAVTIRADRYEPLQTASELAGVRRVVFDELGPMPAAGYAEVITGPARRATAAGRRLTVEPALVERLLTETAEGADALPLLALTLERLYHDFGATAI